MTLLSKTTVLVSLLGALAFNTWQAGFAYAHLPALTAVAAVAGLIGGRFFPRPAAAAVLLFAYWVPALFAALVGRFYSPFFVVWTGALVGVVVGDRDRLTWSYPQQWRFPLILWAWVVALGWPLVALREMDFESLSLLERYRISNTGIGGSPTMMVTWAADFALVHLLGLLWFEWLFRRAASRDLLDVQRWIALPLAIGAIAASGLAVYQGVVDISFLSGGVWPSVSRAAGSLMDANAFGMIAALWSAGLLAFSGSAGVRAFGLAGALICWAGLWMSGSRTALLAGVVGIATVGLAALRRRGRLRLRTREVVVGAMAIGVAAAALILVPVNSESPLQRLRNTLPADASRAAVVSTLRELWDRNTYGVAATALILQHPTVGVGIGMFHMMGADYLRVHAREIPPDNAQNWWRHYVAEMGVLGSAGILFWTAWFLTFLWRTKGEGERCLPAAALKGAIVAISLASLLGMPAQSLPVAITFWTFAFWYTRLVDRTATWTAGGLRPVAWAVLGVLLSAYLGTTLALARGDLRPPVRAAEGGWRYTYGMYDPPSAPADGTQSLWTERHGVAVIPADGPLMVLAVRAEHPDISQHPVKALVKVDGHIVVDTTLYTDAPIVRRIETGSAPRAMIETRVDRTWRSARSSDHDRDVGLVLSWRFVQASTPH